MGPPGSLDLILQPTGTSWTVMCQVLGISPWLLGAFRFEWEVGAGMAWLPAAISNPWGAFETANGAGFGSWPCWGTERQGHPRGACLGCQDPWAQVLPG